ncbi:MAG: glutaconate CoA-transferase, subunit [Thermomicrobiales bacterium]|nr:glutaconate CoA-transferase, subunit [Thermomicrobiales bacterium]
MTRNSPDVVSLEQLATYVEDGARLGMGGFHFSRLPIALVQAVVARGVKDLEYISWGGSLGLELLLQADAVRTLTLCFNSLDVFGLAPRFRKAVEEGRVALEEWTALGMMQGHHAAQHGLPSMPFPLPVGSEIVERSGFATVYDDPVTGKPVGAARALPLDVFLIHAQRADEQGNVEIQGGRGLDLSAVFATRDVLVTVEEIVPASTFQSEGAPRAHVLPRSFVRAIAVAPNGAYPTSCLPYYPTDYRELMRVTAVDTLEIRQPSVERSRFLRAAATVDPEVVTGAALRKHRAGEPEADDAPATVDEIMVSWLARQYTNESVCSVGSVSPLATVSYFLAKRTHAPELVLMTANGGLIDVAARPMMMTLAEPLDFQTAAMHCGGDDSYHSYYQRGLVTHEVVSAAQIDRHANTNNIEVVSPSGKRIRLPGQGGMADVSNMHANFLLYVTRHSPLTLVERVDYVSAARGLLTDEERIAAGYQPGRVLLITNLCVFGLDVDSRELEVVSIHPGVTPNDVQAATGFPVRLAANVEMTAIPTVDDLRLIRTDIDPLGMRRLEFVAGKERGPLLAALIESEEAAIVESTGVAAGA